MASAVAHRGPDHQGVWREGSVGLCHRRLAIIDLSERSIQPMHSADDRYVIVFNGEIYNYRELKTELAAAGQEFRTTGDTEVVLCLFAREGNAAFARLNGMFAVAIWDRQDRRLTLARDRFGQKPLYLWRTSGELRFGSEIKSLLVGAPAKRALDWAALHEYAFFGATLGQRTLFDGIEKLPAGHVLTHRAGESELTAFWRADMVPAQADRFDDAVVRVRELMDRAVDRHMVSDVPVGVFLSGGIDSSAVTMFASRRVSSLATYSVGFDFDPGELPKARFIADHAKTDHHEIRVHGTNLEEVVRALVRHHDQPFGDAANIPLFLLAKELKGQLKVVLGGDGGDEIFAGYRRYNVLSFAPVWRALAKSQPLLERMPRGRRRDRLLRFLRAVGEPDDARRMALLLTEETESPSPLRHFTPAVRGELCKSNPFARYVELAARLRGRDPVAQMLRTDCSILLPDIFCEKVDRATMAHSLEVRLPFLDTELTDYVIGLPSKFKVHRMEKKWLLRCALRGVVPDQTLDAPKRGFGVPYGTWMRGPLAKTLRTSLLEGRAAREGILDVEACRTTIAEHASGRLNHEFLLYKLLELAIWYEEYL